MLRAVIPLKKSSIHHNITVTSLSSAFQQCNITGSPPASMVLFRTIQASKASIRFENRLKTLREMRERGIEPEKPHNYAKLPCVDATQLAAARKVVGKQKVYRKKLRFIKGNHNRDPYFMPSVKSPLYSIIQQTRNTMELKRQERERQELIQMEHNAMLRGLNKNKTTEESDAVQSDNVDISKFMVSPEHVMTKKEAKAAGKAKKKPAKNEK